MTKQEFMESLREKDFSMEVRSFLDDAYEAGFAAAQEIAYRSAWYNFKIEFKKFFVMTAIREFFARFRFLSRDELSTLRWEKRKAQSRAAFSEACRSTRARKA
jgi:hypothetical protein